jgi:hypothetical protein
MGESQYIPREGPYYVVTFTNVDGAGRYHRRYTDPREAIAAAESAAERSGPDGGPWAYRYAVLRSYVTVYRDDVVYRARIR